MRLYELSFISALYLGFETGPGCLRQPETFGQFSYLDCGYVGP